MKIRGPNLPLDTKLVDTTLDTKRTSSASNVKAEELPPKPDASKDVFGGVGERLQITARAWDPKAMKALDGELAKLATDARGLSDHVESGADATAISRGVGRGVLVKTAAEAEQARREGKPYVLLLKTPTPSLLEAAVGAEAIVVLGRKSDAGRVAAAIGKPAVRVASLAFETGTQIVVDGTTGKIAAGSAKTVAGKADPVVDAQIDKLRKRHGLTVTAQASTVESVKEARLFGADRLRVDAYALLAGKRPLFNVRRFLLESEAAPRRAALENVVALAKPEARKLIDASGSLPITFVLGDQSPQSFFPSTREGLDQLAQELGLPPQLVADRVGELGAGNSKLGLRGARWAVKDPDLFAGWARAIFEAFADEVEAGKKPGALRIHIPNVALGGEMELVKARLEQEKKIVEDEYGIALPVTYGAGIDTARGALSADEISSHVDAVEYGASELTETLYAISRDDAEQYLPKMLKEGLLPADPFATMDVDALGKMIRVGQYLAGGTPNAFPASLSGPQALTANGIFVAAQAGMRDLVVPASASLQARMLDAKVQNALEATKGVHVPKSDLHDGPTKLFDLLVSRGDNVKKGGTKGVPDGVTALEHVERLQKQVEAGTMTTAEALMSVPPNIVDQLSKPVVDPSSQVAPLSKGIAASPGCGQGRVALSKEAAAELALAGDPYVLMVNEVHADEVEATRKAAGLVSVRGGKTSHAAMIASNSEVPCVMEEKVQINLENKTVGVGRSRVKEGDWITIDGTKGQILPGKLPLLNPTKSTAFASLMKWADEHRTLDVLANADTPQEAATAFARGASGVGLVRSEHMFYEADRLLAFRAVILSDIGARPDEMAALEKAQTDDYTALFTTAGEKKVAVRLLDPPLYEFLPTKPAEVEELAKSLGVPAAKLAERISAAQEVDSMLGMRGVRLALTRPDIEAMQVRSLARAYVEASKSGPTAPLHIIVPQVSAAAEMVAAKARILDIIGDVQKESGTNIAVKLGSMIETPRAALEASAIGEVVDFFSYGTNDLTQGTLGYGRNVAAKFIPELIKSKALSADPTESLDDKGVVKLIRVAESLGKGANPDLYGGVCGGQAGDPASIDSVQAAGLKYISVSPGQVAKARVAAGQAAVKASTSSTSASSSAASAAPDNAAPDAVAPLVASLTRSLSGIHAVPTDASQQGHIDLVELHLRRATTAVRTLQREGASIEHLAPLMRAVTDAREVLDTDRLARALTSEVAALRTELAAAGGGGKALKSAAGAAGLADAEQAALEFSKAATESLGQPRTTGGERAVAAFAWKALRAFEGVRTTLIAAGALPSSHRFHARLWHHNDGWDNQHYSNAGPKKGESMTAFMSRVAQTFLDDNGMEVHLTGTRLADLPKDRPIILAVAHRSGAIDRFVTMGALPIGKDDELMYVVRKGSPYDVIAQEHLEPKDNPILAPENAEDFITRAKDGFANGRRVLLTYPQGTGTIAGESRYPAASVVRLAQETGALIVPVTSSDTFDTRPFDGSNVTLRVHDPIDPLLFRTDVGAEVVHTALHYELTSGYRAKL